MEYLLGVDVGTSSCKALLTRADGSPAESATVEYHPSTPEPGAVEMDPETLWSAACECISKLASRVPRALSQVTACAATGQMRGLIALGEDLRPLRPAILWNDNRCAGQLEALRRGNAAEIEALTRNGLNTMCTLPKILWLREHEPHVLSRMRLFVFPKDYIAFKLTGVLSTDVSDASGSSLFSPETVAWEPFLIQQAGLRPGQLPEIRASNEVTGSLTREAAAATRLPAGLPVAVGMSDATAEMLALGITGPELAKIRLGTSGAVSTVVEELPEHGTGLYCWSYLDGRRWMLDVNTRSCAGAVEWARRLLYGDTGNGDRNNADRQYAAMIEEAGTVAAGSDGVLFHPYLRGEDAPYWDSTLTGSLSGLKEHHGRAELTRAVYEGTAFALREAFGVFGSVVSAVSSFRFTGGGTLNPLWLRIVANVLGIGGSVSRAPGAAYGASLCAGLAAGVYADPEEVAAAAENTLTDRIVPDSQLQATYEELYHRYRATAPAGEQVPRHAHGKDANV